VEETGIAISKAAGRYQERDRDRDGEINRERVAEALDQDFAGEFACKEDELVPYLPIILAFLSIVALCTSESFKFKVSLMYYYFVIHCFSTTHWPVAHGHRSFSTSFQHYMYI
jgi:hypothetical protein